MRVVRAPAKLTRSLRIVGVRGDGYHLLDAEMVSLDLADVLGFEPGDGLVVRGPAAGDVPAGDANLVRRALAAVERQAHVVVTKHIPAGAGLGGGSSDAAAVLRWAGCADLGVAARLGADVPFCLAGGRARVTGVGEQLEPLEFVDAVVTLVLVPLVVATAAAYSAWDALGQPRAQGPNDLEPAALAVAPALGRWRDRIAEAAGRAPTLAGSGSTWFVDGAHPALAIALPDARVVVARTTPAEVSGAARSDRP